MVQRKKAFLKELMCTRGRRSEVNTNAFWAAATMPTHVFENRKVRAVMRALNLSYRTVKRTSTVASTSWGARISRNQLALTGEGKWKHKILQVAT